MAKVTSITDSISNEVTEATAKRLGDGEVKPIKRPKIKIKK